ncbi:HdeD family acid-resistance protein [Corynebacterium glutamicum]|uniref:HdeD family acid-resistance protein n=1 Tax=Corynebacterium glutamicum TaxID=1718 RepID=UPI0009432B41|nr:DUF308 domain-containing protein [Corynebacterium glutamicum]OKX84285.1 hypothetical protein AUO95_03650 [Corynebacterium glutamicum]
MIDFAKRSATILIITGALAVIFGIFALASPVSTALALVLIWGWYALIDGILEIIAAFRPEHRSSRGFLLATGIIGVASGLLVVFRTLDSAIAIAWILGIWLILRGASELLSAAAPKEGTSRFFLAFSGVLFIIAGIIFIANPGSAALTVSTVLGILAISWGAFTLFGGISTLRENNRIKTATDSETSDRV